ncbi:MAG: alanine racemase [Deltaproteobacteria bacterium]|nr:alanine racemase [Deltaproteobacteria bacterium]
MPLKENQKYRSWVEVDLDHFTRNWAEMKRLVGSGVRILQVVKADAYGHGAIEISNVALKNGAAMLGVANADEAVQLRVSGITAPILILSPSTNSEINEIIKYNLVPSVSDLSFARELQKIGKKAAIRVPIHIEVDTGMGRGGTMHHEAFKMIKEILDLPNLSLEGIFTHLSSSEVMEDYNRMQWSLFRELLDKLDGEAIRIPVKHMANSGAILNFSEFHLDMVRPGLMSYGIYPSAETKTKASLYPVMCFKTRVVLIKEFPKGYSIGYGRSYITDKPTKVATIPVGYGDGYGRILSNRGEALIRGRRTPVIGRVSMDMCTLDVTHIPDCQIGDEVVLMGRQGQECISADDLAAKLNTISYEILCALGKRAPRIFFHKGKTDTVEPRLRRIFIPDEEKSISRIDNIIRYCFQTRARDEELGDAIYYEMFETLFGKEDRQLELRTNFRYDIRVSEFPRQEVLSDPLTGDYFKVTTHIEYIKTLKNPIFMIGCALNDEQLAGFFEDKQCEYRWLLNRGEDLVMERDFRVNSVRIDHEDIPIIRTENTARGYEVWCGEDKLKKKLNRPARVEIEILTKKSKSNNIFSVYLVYPTRGLDISFNYEGINFKYVREVSFFSGKQPYPEVTREKGKSVKLRISDNEWVFPNSGVAFFWGF